MSADIMNESAYSNINMRVALGEPLNSNGGSTSTYSSYNENDSQLIESQASSSLAFSPQYEMCRAKSVNLDNILPESVLTHATIRNYWFTRQMKARKANFTKQKKLTICCATWNVNAKRLHDTKDIKSWFDVFSNTTSGSGVPDIFAVGCQEIVDLTAQTLLSAHHGNEYWENTVERGLSSLFPKHKFKLICSKHLVGIWLSVFVRASLLPNVSEVNVDSQGVGVMGVGGNKGAVAIRFRVYDSSICIINSHLASGVKHVLQRNADFHNLIKRLSFNSSFSIYDHDQVFWMGDMNYRLSLSNAEHMMSLVEEKNWGELLHYDQLQQEKDLGRIFVGWKEGKVDFPPTYKFLPGTDIYTSTEYDGVAKKRNPAWCDRVLWYGDGILLQSYKSIPTLNISDHKPVVALFSSSIEIVDRKLEEGVYADLVKVLDAWENEQVPKISLSTNRIELGDILYCQEISQDMRLENTGQVSAQWQFIPKLHETSVCPPWLSISPLFGILLPGEDVAIRMSVFVCGGGPHVLALNSGEEKLEDIVLLRVERGADHFLDVSGNYLPSCFGTSLSYLIHTPQPVRFAASSLSNDFLTMTHLPLVIPKEIWRLIDVLFQSNCWEEPGIFLAAGDPYEVTQIRECLDIGEEFGTNFSLHSFAETLLALLSSLAEPVFPPSLSMKYKNGIDISTFAYDVLSQLQSVHSNVFLYFIMFIRDIFRSRRRNARPLFFNDLTLVFSQVLMHSERICEHDEVGNENHWIIFKYIVENENLI